MNIAKIEDLKINLAKTLNNEVKKHLVEIIEEEFRSQTTMYDSALEDHKRKTLEQYRKRIGYENYQKKIRSLELKRDALSKQREEIVEEIALLGLDTTGSGYDN